MISAAIAAFFFPGGSVATVQYPDRLPLPQRASQNMTQDTGFRTTQPAIGPAIFTPITTDLKATWSLTWIFTLQQAQVFKSWLRSPTYCDSGRNWFEMAIDLGDNQGPQVQTLHFTGMPVQTSKDGITVTWTATVICNGLNDINEAMDDLIVVYGGQEGIIDIAINRNWPGVQ